MTVDPTDLHDTVENWAQNPNGSASEQSHVLILEIPIEFQFTSLSFYNNIPVIISVLKKTTQN